ncbi:MFS transporter [Novosphingobium sp. B 225]|uniref:MFS transporter n=1 Tax=Novosphingobium sp. B 225 TaxID=1961849 RepID=UPI000B4AC468|nr:MFS transporter [Novosphingobium sp. B 225]
MTKQEQARLWPLLAYSGPMIAMSIVNLLLIAYVPNFYAAEIGISIATVGAIFMAARAFDAVIDPIIGNWSDRTRGKWGRRKPWIAFGVPAFMVMTWAFFQPPADVGMTYLLVAALLFYVTYAIVIIPYMSWGAEIRRDYEGRTQINSLREAGGILGTILATLLPVLVLPLFVEGDPTLRQILALLALTIIVVLAITVPIALRSAPQGEFEPHPPLGLFAALGLLRKNKPLLRMLVAIFVVWLGGAFHNSTILFYVTEGLGLGRADFLWLILAQYLMALISLPAWNKLANRLGRHRVLVLGAMGYFLAHQGFHFVPQGGFAGAIAVYIMAGFMTPVIWVMPPAIIADTVDYGMLKGGSDDSALYLALYAFVQKMALAIGVGLALTLAGNLGFDPQAPVTPQGVEALRLVTLILPGIIALAGCLLIWNYPITQKRHAIIRKWLARRAGGHQ